MNNKCLEEHCTRERFVIARRYGLADDREWTLQGVNKSLGVSRERARQIELAAKRKLRRAYLRRQRVRAPDRRPRPRREPH